MWGWFIIGIGTLVFLFVQRCSAKHHFGGESGRITDIIDNGLLLIQGLHVQKENR